VFCVVSRRRMASDGICAAVAISSMVMPSRMRHALTRGTFCLATMRATSWGIKGVLSLSFFVCVIRMQRRMDDYQPARNSRPPAGDQGFLPDCFCGQPVCCAPPSGWTGTVIFTLYESERRKSRKNFSPFREAASLYRPPTGSGSPGSYWENGIKFTSMAALPSSERTKSRNSETSALLSPARVR